MIITFNKYCFEFNGNSTFGWTNNPIRLFRLPFIASAKAFNSFFEIDCLPDSTTKEFYIFIKIKKNIVNLTRPKLKKSLKNKEEHILVIYNMCSSFILLKRPIIEEAWPRMIYSLATQPLYLQLSKPPVHSRTGGFVCWWSGSLFAITAVALLGHSR